MGHSTNYEKVKHWFNLGVWNEIRVHNAVKMGWITEGEFEKITGKNYQTSEGYSDRIPKDVGNGGKS